MLVVGMCAQLAVFEHAARCSIKDGRCCMNGLALGPSPCAGGDGGLRGVRGHMLCNGVLHPWRWRRLWWGGGASGAAGSTPGGVGLGA